MKAMRLRLIALLVPTLILGVVILGCGGKDDKGGGSGSSDGKSGGDGGSSSSGKVALEGKGHGTLKGKVTYDGTPPDMSAASKDLQAKMKEKDATHCLAMNASDEEKSAYEWVVNPQNKGVKNVIVWLAPPDGQYFKLSDAEKKPAQAEVVIDQPHCAFVPHVAVAFTHYYDGKTLQKTGQKVVFKNSAQIPHNTNYKGISFPGRNQTLNPGGQQLVAEDIKPEKGETVVSCEIHTWMRAYIRDFDHPYAAVTDNDGNFEIKNVPTGVPVQLVYWHEKGGYGEGGNKGKMMTLKEGETVDLKTKAK